ncbi:MAG: hypothetical protein ACM31O_21035 [Bacteroidota bacterium]
MLEVRRVHKPELIDMPHAQLLDWIESAAEDDVAAMQPQVVLHLSDCWALPYVRQDRPMSNRVVDQITAALEKDRIFVGHHFIVRVI